MLEIRLTQLNVVKISILTTLVNSHLLLVFLQPTTQGIFPTTMVTGVIMKLMFKEQLIEKRGPIVMPYFGIPLVPLGLEVREGGISTLPIMEFAYRGLQILLLHGKRIIGMEQLYHFVGRMVKILIFGNLV